MPKIEGSYMRDVIFYDLETTGLDPMVNEIMQIGAISQKTGEEFNIHVEFDIEKASPEALAINHYDPSTPRVPLRTALEAFASFCRRNPAIVTKSDKSGKSWRSAVLHGYNNLSFDKPFLEKAFRDHNIFQPYSFVQFDWFNMAVFVFGDRSTITQTAVAGYLGIEVPNAHDALADVHVLREIAKALAPNMFK